MKLEVWGSDTPDWSAPQARRDMDIIYSMISLGISSLH